jgi:hypothetical protein
MHIFVVGQAKSGTTALYSGILQALPGKVFTLHEPTSAQQMESVFSAGGADHTLSKVLLGEAVSSGFDFSRADKLVYICRDPRDNLISRLLYRAQLFKRNQDGAAFEQYATMIQAKVDGEDIAVETLFQEALRLTGASTQWSGLGLQRSCDSAIAFVAGESGCCVLKFEDLVDANLASVGDYLGIELGATIRVEQKFQSVVRSKAYGEWANWFTPHDVDFYRPLFAQYMEFFGYADDYTLPAQQQINEQNSIDYIQQFKPNP